jgi:hypothetical protein
MSFEIEGKLIEKFETVQISDSFQKREFVLETEENNGGNIYNQNIKFQLIQKGCGEIDSSNVGDVVKVHFNLQGRKWEKDGKTSYFNSLNAWRIEKLKAIPQSGQSAEPTVEDSQDKLPF